MEKEPILIERFDGGWNSEDASDILLPSESPDPVNARFTKGGAITKVPGMVQLGSDSDSGKISGLVKSPNRNGIDYLFKFLGTKLKIYDSVNKIWSTIKIGLTSGEKWGDDTFNNILILVSQVDTAMSLDLGTITRLDGAIVDDQGTISVDDASQLAASGDVYINDTLVSYSGKSDNDLTGCTNAVATNDNYLVTQALTDQSAIPKGNMAINFGGRLIIAGVLTSGGSVIYGSKATSRTNFTIAGGGAADDSFAEALKSQIKAIRVFYDDSLNERIMVFLSSNEIYNIEVDDDATLGTLVFSRFFKGNVTAINHFSTIVGENDIFHVDLENQIRTLGPKENADGSGRNFSDSISAKHKTLFRDKYNFSNSRGVVKDNEFWCLAREDNNTYNDRIIIYDQLKGAWRKRIGFMLVDILNYNNKITVADAVQNKVYQVDQSATNNDNNPIYFKYPTLDINKSPLTFERVKAVRISGIISSNCSFTVKIYRDFGVTLLGTYTIRGSNNDIIESILGDGGSFGSIAFGGVQFGGEEVEDRRFFIAHLDLKALPDLENFRVVIENNQQGVYLEIRKIKPLIFTLDENYFPSNYILKK